jgi:hypothetical protein
MRLLPPGPGCRRLHFTAKAAPVSTYWEAGAAVNLLWRALYQSPKIA